MTDPNPNDYAFPRTSYEEISGAPGLTKREYFAALILSGIAEKCMSVKFSPTESAQGALALADALIAELDK